MNINPSISRQEVLRNLGYNKQPLDPELYSLIDTCITDCLKMSIPRYCYEIISCHPVSITDSSSSGEYLNNCEIRCFPKGIQLASTNIILKGKAIYDRLKNASKVAVMAATLGASYDNHMRLSQAKSVTRGLIFDACGSQYIENICDCLESEIASLAMQDNFSIIARFSPGYGDLPLSQQGEIIDFLNANRRIGLTCTPSYIMLPRKSVTAVIGFIPVGAKREDPPRTFTACDICQFEHDCDLKKEGKHCGH